MCQALSGRISERDHLALGFTRWRNRGTGELKQPAQGRTVLGPRQPSSWRAGGPRGLEENTQLLKLMSDKAEQTWHQQQAPGPPCTRPLSGAPPLLIRAPAVDTVT